MSNPGDTKVPRASAGSQWQKRRNKANLRACGDGRFVRPPHVILPLSIPARVERFLCDVTRSRSCGTLRYRKLLSPAGLYLRI